MSVANKLLIIDRSLQELSRFLKAPLFHLVWSMFLRYSKLISALLIILFFSNNYSIAQFQAPYKIKNNYENGSSDSIWVLFPDIQSSNKKIIVTAQAIKSPHNLHLGDSINLDSLYKMEIIIVDIQWSDSSHCVVLCKMPTRENAILKLKYRTFGKVWVFEGDTGNDPLSCDHLTIRQWDENTISFGTSLSLNCK